MSESLASLALTEFLYDAIIFSDLTGQLDEHIPGVGQRCGLVSSGFASRDFLTSRLISRQVRSSVCVGEKDSDFTQSLRIGCRERRPVFG